MLRIVTDGAADMPLAWEELFAIHILPLRVSFGNETYTQGPGFTCDDFYRLVREKKIIPKTSLPSIGQVKEFYRSIASKGDTILSIHISSKLSGTFATVQAAMNELGDEFKIFVVDSAAGSVAQAFMAREARQMEQAGVGIHEILHRLEYIRNHWTVIFTLDNLEFAHMSGRINALQNLMATALKLKPIVILRDGLLGINDKVRTRSRSLDFVIQKVQEKLGGQLVNLAVVHAADPQTAFLMLERLKSELKINDSLITDLAIPVAANLGPGAIGVAAYPIEED